MRVVRQKRVLNIEHKLYAPQGHRQLPRYLGLPRSMLGSWLSSAQIFAKWLRVLWITPTCAETDLSLTLLVASSLTPSTPCTALNAVRHVRADQILMNAKELTKNVGLLFRLRPKPFGKDSPGQSLAEVDDKWRLDSVIHKPTRIQLTNTRTGQQLKLEADNIMERRSPDFLILRCEVTIGPDSVDLEPIHRGSPLIPEKTRRREEKGERPKYINLPAGYERRLNYHRYRIAKDSAAKDEDGGYRFPVRVKGVNSNVRAFEAELIKRIGVFPTITRVSDGVGELEFTYVGFNDPETIENLAIKYGLIILQCGNPFAM